jgi:hypothetical protein
MCDAVANIAPSGEQTISILMCSRNEETKIGREMRESL